MTDNIPVLNVYEARRVNMRKKIFIVAVATSIALTGCASVPTLSEQQNDAIAEYVADNLLKNDENYTSTVKLNNDFETAEPVATPYIEPTSAATPMESETPAGDNITNLTSTQVPLSSGEPETSAKPEKTYVSLSNAINLSGVSVKTGDYKCGSEINTNDSNISASKGNKLLVFNFKLKNNSSAKKKIDMTKKNISYQLSINGKKMNSPLLTIAGEDIHFIKKNIAPGKSIKAILVFEIPSNTKLKDVVLEVTNKDATAQVKIK